MPADGNGWEKLRRPQYHLSLKKTYIRVGSFARIGTPKYRSQQDYQAPVPKPGLCLSLSLSREDLAFRALPLATLGPKGEAAIGVGGKTVGGPQLSPSRTTMCAYWQASLRYLALTELDLDMSVAPINSHSHLYNVLGLIPHRTLIFACFDFIQGQLGGFGQKCINPL